MPMQTIEKVVLDPRERLEQLLEKEERKLKREFVDAVQHVKDDIQIERLSILINQGRFEEAIALAGSIPVVLASAINDTVVTAGQNTAKQIAKVTKLEIRFDQTNDRAVNLMRNNRFRLIREFTDGQRNATRAALIDGLQRGLNPRDQARAFRGSIGLTERQMGYVHNYRKLLENNSSDSLQRRLRDRRFDTTVRRSIDTDTPLTKTQINKMVGRYQERFIKHRSEVIARTESLSAINEANDEAFQQSFDEGILNSDELINEWLTARDSRVRESHNGMNGQQRKEGEPFISDAGNLLRYPGDRNAPGAETIHCRCTKIRRFS